MYLLMTAILCIIGFFNLWLTAIGINRADKATLKKEIERAEWAKEHEDEWLPYTDRVIREGDSLYYYGYNKPHKKSEGWHLKVQWGYDSKRQHYGLIYNGEVVFGYDQLICFPTKHPRLHYINNKRAIDLGEYSTLGKYCGGNYYHMYKIIDADEYYIYANNDYYKIKKFYYLGNYAMI